MLRYSLQSYQAVSSMADQGLRRAAKRYPCLIPALLPTLLSAVGGLELPSQRQVLDGLQGKPVSTSSSARYTICEQPSSMNILCAPEGGIAGH